VEYKQGYLVTREMHLRPCTEAYNFIQNAKDECKGLEFRLFSKFHDTIDGHSIMELMLFAANIHNQKLEITTLGDHDEEILRRYNNNLGYIFMKDEN